MKIEEIKFEQKTAELARLMALQNQGGVSVTFVAVVSIGIMTFRHPVHIEFKQKEGIGLIRFVWGVVWAVFSGVLGWWGVPWGFIYTPIAIVTNLLGGTESTQAQIDMLNSELNVLVQLQKVT